MRIVFCFVPALSSRTQIEELSSAPMSIYLLAAVVNRYGYKTEIIDPVEFKEYEGEEQLEDKFYNHIIDRVGAEDVIAFSYNSFNWAITNNVVKKIKRQLLSIKVILGGLHVSVFDVHALKCSGGL